VHTRQDELYRIHHYHFFAMFTHLHLHTHYSLLESIGSPKAYIEQAKLYGMEALACTDFGGMYGAIEFYQAAKKAQIKPILWVELWYVQDMKSQDTQESAGTIVLLARDYTGYTNLMQLISKAHLTGFHKIPRIDHHCLAQFSSGLIALVWGDRSWLGKKLLQNNEKALCYDQRQQLANTLGSEHCYVSRIAQESPTGILHQCNKLIQEFSKQHTIPLLVSGDVHYIQTTDQYTFEIALAIKDGKRIYDTDRRLASHQMHLQTETEIISWLRSSGLSEEQITSMIGLTDHVAKHIDISIPMDTILFPIYESPVNIKTAFAKREKKLIL
jgi:DNA polymerase-3 subunit alpha